MSDLYDAAREVRGAIADVWSELRDLVEVLRSIKSALRDISDVMHAQYYGVGPGEEGEPGSDE